jgi:hypothetical protein
MGHGRGAWRVLVRKPAGEGKLENIGVNGGTLLK